MSSTGQKPYKRADPAAGLPSDPGSYVLVWRCHSPVSAMVGALGGVRLAAGTWLYVGSARGPGGLAARIRRHWRTSVKNHWHLDYVKPLLEPVEAWAQPGLDNLEHRWAGLLSRHGRGIPGFGCSDCCCPSHFFHWRQPWPSQAFAGEASIQVSVTPGCCR